MVPQLPSLTVAEQNGKFTAGRVVSIAGWCLLSVGAQQWSGHRGRLQIISCSFFHWNICGARLAHEASPRRIFGPACCLRRRRASWEKRETRNDRDELKPTRSFRLQRHPGFYFAPSDLRIEPKTIQIKFKTSYHSIS